MIPISDDDSARRLTPVVTYVLIALNALVFFLELNSGDALLSAGLSSLVAFLPIL